LKVCGTQNDLRPLLRAANNQNSQALNWLFHHIKQDQDDANGFSLFVWDMKQKKVWRKQNEMIAIVSDSD
jgi:hypothetical protein